MKNHASSSKEPGIEHTCFEEALRTSVESSRTVRQTLGFACYHLIDSICKTHAGFGEAGDRIMMQINRYGGIDAAAFERRDEPQTNITARSLITVTIGSDILKGKFIELKVHKHLRPNPYYDVRVVSVSINGSESSPFILAKDLALAREGRSDAIIFSPVEVQQAATFGDDFHRIGSMGVIGFPLAKEIPERLQLLIVGECQSGEIPENAFPPGPLFVDDEKYPVIL